MFTDIANAPAKVIKEFRKKHDKPVFKAAHLDASFYIGEEYLDTLSELKFKFKSKLWVFIQDPWPDPLKDFNIDDQTFVLRFTYDEGCEMDRTWREWDTEDGYYMLTDKEIVKL